MADEEKRLPEEEAEHPPETDVSSDSKEPSFDAHAPETLEDGQPDSGDTQPDHMQDAGSRVFSSILESSWKKSRIIRCMRMQGKSGANAGNQRLPV